MLNCRNLALEGALRDSPYSPSLNPTVSRGQRIGAQNRQRKIGSAKSVVAESAVHRCSGLHNWLDGCRLRFLCAER